jgi:hypothetical protein
MRRLLKITLFGLLFVLLGGVALYFWLLKHMEEVIRTYIHRQSDGIVNLDIGRASYDNAGQVLTLHDTRVISNEKPGHDNRYDIRVKSFRIRVGPLRQILRTGKLGILDLECESPSVEVIKLRPGKRNKDFSLPDEISRVYLYMEDALRNLEIGKVRIRNGSFSVSRAYDGSSPPLVLKGIDLTVDGIGMRKTSDIAKGDVLDADIRLETGRQDIRFPDGIHGMRFRRLRLDTRNRLAELDSCEVYGNRSDSNRADFDILFDGLRIVNADLAALAEQDLVKADSALCYKPRVRFSLDLRNGAEKFTLGRTRDAGFQDSVETAFKQLVGNLDIAHIGVMRADVDITTTRNGHSSRYTARKSDFTIGGLRIVEDPSEPIRVERFDFEIKDYLGYSSDSLYAIRFDSISLRDRLVGFRNFSIRATAMNPEAEWREVRMRAFELEGVYWPELLFRNRIQADAARLVAPTVEVNLTANRRRAPRPRGSLYTVLSGFRKFVEMDALYLQDASVAVRSPNGTLLRMDGFHSLVDVRELLESGDASQLVGSIRNFSFTDGSLSNSTENISLESGVFDGATDRLRLERATYRNKRNPLVILAEGLVLTQAEQTLDNQFKASEVSWQRADIRMERQSSAKVREPGVQEKPLLIGWDRTLGNDTRLSIESGNTSLYTNIRSLETGPVMVPTDGKPRINGLDLVGNSLVFQEGLLRTGIGSYRVIDERASQLTDVRISLPAGPVILQTVIPSLDVVPDLESLIDNKPSISSLHLQRPIVRIRPNPDSVRSRGKVGLPTFIVAELRVTDAVVEDPDLLLPKGQDIVFRVPSVQVRNLRSSSQSIGAVEARLELEDVRFSKQGLSLVAPATTRVVLSGLSYQPGEERRRARWRMGVDSLSTPELGIGRKAEGEVPERTLGLKGVSLSNAVWNDGNRKDPAAILRESGNLGLSIEGLSMRGAKEHLDLHGIEYRHELRRLTADSSYLRPALDREAFMRSLTYQKDHLELKTGRIALERLDAEAFAEEEKVRVGSVEMHRPLLTVYKDRRIPYLKGIVKPLPTQMLRSIPLPIRIDSLRWRKGTILYEELNDVTDRSGTVPLTSTELLLTNIRNEGASETDSLGLTAETRLLDKADIRLGFKESYTDTLNAFLLNVKVGRFDLTELNGILEPMASARIRSGHLDTLRLKAIGREYLAWGKMQMYYSDLKVQFLDKSDNERKTLLTRLSNFLANTALRQGNRKKTGTVYAERNRERSVFNYWIRIVLSGALTNAGIRGNDRQERRFHREVRRLEVPEIPDLDLD